MKTVSLRLPDSLAARLTAHARAQRRSKSEVVRELLEESLAQDSRKDRLSCLDLAGDLVGCLEGPGDLSVNKKHMEGFGK